MRWKTTAHTLTTLGLVTFIVAPATAGDCSRVPIKGDTTVGTETCTIGDGPEVITDFTVPCNGDWTISVQADFQWILAVGTASCTLGVGDADYDDGDLTVNLSTGTTYYATVDSYDDDEEGEFLLTFTLAAARQYRVIDLGTLPSAWNPRTDGTFGINNDGDVAYGAKNGVGSLVPKVWDGSTITILDFPGSTSTPGVARDFNGAGQIVGQVDGIEIDEGNAVFWEPNSGDWDATKIDASGDTNCPWARAHAINNDTDPVIALESDYGSFCIDDCVTQNDEVAARRGFLTTVSTLGTLTRLDPGDGDLDCYPSTYCRDLNTAGSGDLVVAGFGNQESFNCPVQTNCTQGDYRWAAVWPDTTNDPDALDHFEAGGGHAPILSEALGVNDSGHTVGWGHTSGSGGGSPRAAFWQTPTSTVLNLGDTMPPGQDDDNCYAYAISNEVNDVLYVAGTNTTIDSALLWTRDDNDDWSAVDLNDQNLCAVTLVHAHDVNDNAELVVTGRVGSEHHVYAMRHVELPSCPGDVDESGDVGFSDVLDILGAWAAGCGEGASSCSEDINFDCRIDFGDILLVLANWGSCNNGPEPDSIPDVLDEMGLTFSDWIDFLYTLSTGPEVDQTNYLCWMEHYWTVHFLELCLCAPNCPGDDPWGGHP